MIERFLGLSQLRCLYLKKKCSKNVTNLVNLSLVINIICLYSPNGMDMKTSFANVTIIPAKQNRLLTAQDEQRQGKSGRMNLFGENQGKIREFHFESGINQGISL